jgi:hypothetical protein
MSAGASGAAGAAGAAAMVQAVKAMGVIVRVDAENFLAIVARQESPLVVCAPGNALQRWFNVNSCHYLTSYKGLAFHVTSPEHLPLPEGTEVILAKKIWVPG